AVPVRRGDGAGGGDAGRGVPHAAAGGPVAGAGAPARWRACAWARCAVVVRGLSCLGLWVVLPLASVFAQALDKGVGEYLGRLWAEETRQAIGLTLLTAAIVVPLNTVFGVAGGWVIAK